MIYLDNIATTKVIPEAVKVMLPYFSDYYGNSSSIHKPGIKASAAVEKSRILIAEKINVSPEEIFFTSGGTESNNIVLSGLFNSDEVRKKHLIIPGIEHPSVFEYARFLEKKGTRVTFIPVNSSGLIDPDDIKKAITKETVLVSVMLVNNEIGTIQPVEEIANICREKKVLFHSDICQGFTKMAVDLKKINLDFATLNSHKIHGPKGTGALFIRKGIKLPPLFIGGGQEGNLRPGTHNTPAIVGFGKAVELSDDNDISKMTQLRDYFLKEIFSKIDDVILNGASGNNRVCNNINLIFRNVDGKKIFLELNKKEIIISTGSACHSAVPEPSRIILALGLDVVTAHGAIRIGLSKWTTKEELDITIECIKEIVDKERRIRNGT